MTSTRRKARLAELNAQAEDPNLWNDTARAQRVMQERNALDDQLNAIGRIEQRARRSAHHDRTRRGREGSARHRRGRGRARASSRPKRRGASSRRCCPARPTRNEAYLEVHAGAGGTESQDWASMLLRMYTRWAEQHGYKVEFLEEIPGRGRRHQIGDHPGQGPQRLWLAEDRERRASPGAHLAVRFQRAAAHLVRQRRRSIR